VARRIKKRQKSILLALPSALDLLTISVEAGLSFDAALARVVDKYDNEFSRELTIMLNEVRLGRPRLEALDDVARRCKVEELSNFIQAIIQSETLGVGVANVLRIQSEEIRRKRRQRAEELGQKAPLKMLFPMVGCIFPTLFIVLLGPAVIEVAHQFSAKP
jgi:tight adherence protein C